MLPMVNGSPATFRDAVRGETLVTRSDAEGTRLVSFKSDTLVRVFPGTGFVMTDIPEDFAADHSLDHLEARGYFFPIDLDNYDGFNCHARFDRIWKDLELAELPAGIKVEIVSILGSMPGGGRASDTESAAA